MASTVLGNELHTADIADGFIQESNLFPAVKTYFPKRLSGQSFAANSACWREKYIHAVFLKSTFRTHTLISFINYLVFDLHVSDGAKNTEKESLAGRNFHILSAISYIFLAPLHGCFAIEAKHGIIRSIFAGIWQVHSDDNFTS